MVTNVHQESDDEQSVAGRVSPTMSAMAKKDDLARGDRIRVTQLRQDPQGDPVPADVVGLEGVVEWVTPGFSGEKAVFEIRLDDGRIVQLYAPEIEPV